MTYRLAWEETRAVGDLVHVEKFFARKLRDLVRARIDTPDHEGSSRTMSTHADEKSDEGIRAINPPNKGDSPSAEAVEGRTSPRGSGGEIAAARTLRRDTACEGESHETGI
jgi:hypothetical protein